MSRVTSLLLIVIAGITLIAFSLYIWDRQAKPLTAQSFPPDIDQDDQAKIMATARQMFDDAKAAGQNFDNGPCLGTVPGYANWVVDIAHNPRLPIDNDPANQCEAFRLGKAKHFIEFDLNGQVVKIY